MLRRSSHPSVECLSWASTVSRRPRAISKTQPNVFAEPYTAHSARLHLARVLELLRASGPQDALREGRSPSILETLTQTPGTHTVHLDKRAIRDTQLTNKLRLKCFSLIRVQIPTYQMERAWNALWATQKRKQANPMELPLSTCSLVPQRGPSWPCYHTAPNQRFVINGNRVSHQAGPHVNRRIDSLWPSFCLVSPPATWETCVSAVGTRRQDTGSCRETSCTSLWWQWRADGVKSHPFLKGSSSIGKDICISCHGCNEKCFRKGSDRSLLIFYFIIFSSPFFISDLLKKCLILVQRSLPQSVTTSPTCCVTSARPSNKLWPRSRIGTITTSPLKNPETVGFQVKFLKNDHSNWRKHGFPQVPVTSSGTDAYSLPHPELARAPLRLSLP